MREPRAGDVVRYPFGSLFANSRAWWAVIGLVAVASLASLIPMLGGIATIAAAVLLTPVASTLVRAHAQNQKLTFKQAWDLSTGQFLPFLGYSFLMGVIAFGFTLIWIAIAVTVAIAADSPEAGLMIGLLGVPLLLVFGYWSLTVTSAAASGVTSPLTAFKRWPVGRGIGAILLSSVAFGALGLALFAVWAVVTAAGVGGLLASDIGGLSALVDMSDREFEAWLQDVVSSPQFILVLLSFTVYSALMQVLQMMSMAGFTTLFRDIETAPVNVVTVVESVPAWLPPQDPSPDGGEEQK